MATTSSFAITQLKASYKTNDLQGDFVERIHETFRTGEINRRIDTGPFLSLKRFGPTEDTKNDLVFIGRVGPCLVGGAIIIGAGRSKLTKNEVEVSI